MTVFYADLNVTEVILPVELIEVVEHLTVYNGQILVGVEFLVHDEDYALPTYIVMAQILVDCWDLELFFFISFLLEVVERSTST